MKISKWINLIGIFFIVIGAIPLILEFIFNSQPGVDQITSEQNYPKELQEYWILLNPYFRKFVALMYVIAGIFFLLKKSFSIRLMFFTILIGLLYNILPSLLFTPGSMILISILNPFSLPIIAINLFLLFVVFKMRKLYLGNSNKQFKPVPIKIKKHTSFLILTLLGYALILIPVGFLGLLFYADFSTETHAEFIEVFYRLVPNIFELYGNEINLILCVLCFAVSIICQSAKSIAIRIWNIILLILSILLFMLNLFQMM